jgi:hypothetical protein
MRNTLALNYKPEAISIIGSQPNKRWKAPSKTSSKSSKPKIKEKWRAVKKLTLRK